MVLISASFFEEKNLLRADWLRLVDHIFGENYHLSKDFSSQNYFLFLAEIKGEIIGFCSGYLADKKLISSLNLNLPTKKTAVLDMIGVLPEWQNQKIGSQLYELLENKFKQNKVDLIVQFHWIRKAFPFPILAQKKGFNFSNEIPHFWKFDSLAKNYQCKECGPPPCNCSCAIYLKYF